jgi:allene oxide cyclase
MRKVLFLIGAAAPFLLVVALVAEARSKGPAPRILAPTRIHVVEDATTDTEVDTDGSGGTSDSTGDLLTFHNQVFAPGKVSPLVGHDLGHCILIAPGKSYYCTWTTWLTSRGQIVVQGLFSFKGDTTLAITGGTRRFANARGTMRLHSFAGGTKYDFVFNILP